MKRRFSTCASVSSQAERSPAWLRHLAGLGITARKGKFDPVRIATEGALLGNITVQGLLEGSVILSDNAGQFKVGHYALCWVDAEWLIHKLDTFAERQRAAVARIRTRLMVPEAVPIPPLAEIITQRQSAQA